MKNNPSCTFLFFGTTYPPSINLHPHKLSSHRSYWVKTLNDILQEVWKHFLSLDCPKPLLPKVARPTKRCSQTTLLLQEREPENQIALAPVRLISQKPPPRELQPHNIQLPIIYSMARFSAGINQSRFLAFNRGKLIYAS